MQLNLTDVCGRNTQIEGQQTKEPTCALSYVTLSAYLNVRCGDAVSKYPCPIDFLQSSENVNKNLSSLCYSLISNFWEIVVRLGHYAISRKVTGSIPDEVIAIFFN
jgi:hypothetical protein